METGKNALLLAQTKLDAEKDDRYLAMDKELSEIKDALSDALDDSSSKSTELHALLETVDSLSSSLEETKVRNLSNC